MSFLIAFVCALAALPLCIVSYIIAEKRIQQAAVTNEKADISVPSEQETDGTDVRATPDSPEIGVTKREYKVKLGEFTEKLKNLTALQKFLSAFVFITVGVAAYFVAEQALPWVKTVRILLSLEVLLCAAIVDLYTKKIPNFMPLYLSGLSFVFLIIEFALYRSLAYNSVWLCVVAGLIVFFVLFLVSLFTGGGFGMGDSKLITALTFTGGVVLTLYSVFVGLLICMLVSIFLLVTRKGNLKDQLPFGPFIYIGYIICAVLGNY